MATSSSIVSLCCRAALLVLLTLGLPSLALAQSDFAAVDPATAQQPQPSTWLEADSASDPAAVPIVLQIPLQTEPEVPPLVPTQRRDGYRSEIERAWFTGSPDLETRAAAARLLSLKFGSNVLESAARALIHVGGTDEARLVRAQLAVDLAPDLPSVRIALAKTLLSNGDYLAGAKEALAGLAAIPRNLEASAWLAGSLLAMFAAVLVCSSLAFIVWVGISVFPHAAHDIGDLVSGEMPTFARAALLAAVLLSVLVAGEGLMGIVLGLFALGFTYRGAGYRRALLWAVALLMLGLYPVTRMAGMALTVLDSDRIASAAHSVVRGIESPAELAELQRARESDWLADTSLALHERRAGDPEVALAWYTHLVETQPEEAAPLVTLANMHYERGNNEDAIRLSERAAGLLRSPTLLFNLAQIYARSFRMDEFEGAMAQAQAIDPEAVAHLSAVASSGFVADLPFPLAPIRNRMIQAAEGAAFEAPVLRAVMPGWLGQSWLYMAVAFAIVALVSSLCAGRWEHSSRCGRCGARVCNRCDGSVWNSEICNGCHHLFHRADSTDPAMRVVRLAELRERETRVGTLGLVASLLLPGVGGLLARRPDLSLLGLAFFVWGALLFVWRGGIVSDPLAVGGAGALAFAIAGLGVLLGYIGVVAAGLMARRSL